MLNKILKTSPKLYEAIKSQNSYKFFKVVQIFSICNLLNFIYQGSIKKFKFLINLMLKNETEKNILILKKSKYKK